MRNANGWRLPCTIRMKYAQIRRGNHAYYAWYEATMYNTHDFSARDRVNCLDSLMQAPGAMGARADENCAYSQKESLR